MIDLSEMQSSTEMRRQMEMEGGERLMEMPSFRSISGGQLLSGRLDQVGDEDFEFACASRDSLDGFEPVAAEDIFSDGRIRTVYPLFGRTLRCQDRRDEGDGGAREAKEPADLSLSLRVFIAGNGEPPSSSSSPSSASWESSDELDGVPVESYCVWAPRPMLASPDLRNKSHTMGTSSAASKKWRLRDLVAHSHGKEKFVFVATPGSSTAKAAEKKQKKKGEKSPAAVATREDKKGKGVGRDGGKMTSQMDMVAAHRFYYMKGDSAAAADRRRSLLPHRKYLLAYNGCKFFMIFCEKALALCK